MRRIGAVMVLLAISGVAWGDALATSVCVAERTTFDKVVQKKGKTYYSLTRDEEGDQIIVGMGETVEGKDVKPTVGMSAFVVVLRSGNFALK